MIASELLQNYNCHEVDQSITYEGGRLPEYLHLDEEGRDIAEQEMTEIVHGGPTEHILHLNLGNAFKYTADNLLNCNSINIFKQGNWAHLQTLDLGNRIG